MYVLVAGMQIHVYYIYMYKNKYIHIHKIHSMHDMYVMHLFVLVHVMRAMYVLLQYVMNVMMHECI